jgi:hypothetical protein
MKTTNPNQNQIQIQMQKKSYIIIGDNNFLYSTLRDVTEQELKKEMAFIRKQIKQKHSYFQSPIGESAEYMGVPTELLVYSVDLQERQDFLIN